MFLKLKLQGRDALSITLSEDFYFLKNQKNKYKREVEGGKVRKWEVGKWEWGGGGAHSRWMAMKIVNVETR